jgi:hypothetical protein
MIAGGQGKLLLHGLQTCSDMTPMLCCELNQCFQFSSMSDSHMIGEDPTCIGKRVFNARVGAAESLGTYLLVYPGTSPVTPSPGRLLWGAGSLFLKQPSTSIHRHCPLFPRMYLLRVTTADARDTLESICSQRSMI